MGDKLVGLAGAGEFWWIEQGTPDQVWSPVLRSFAARAGAALFDDQELGACRLVRVAVLPEQEPLAVVDTAGGPIHLLGANVAPSAGTPAGSTPGAETLALVLYWQAEAPVAASYTVFTQLLDAAGQLVAQQDNVPVNGLAPTNTWQAGATIRDAYRLALPPALATGDYTLMVGMYDDTGRRMLTLADGTRADHLALPVRVD
jgi:hypothetical protein